MNSEEIKSGTPEEVKAVFDSTLELMCQDFATYALIANTLISLIVALNGSIRSPNGVPFSSNLARELLEMEKCGMLEMLEANQEELRQALGLNGVKDGK